MDGVDSTSFLRSDAADQKTSGDLRFNNNIGITFGGSDNSRIFHDGTDLSLDLTAYVTDFKIRDGTTERYTFTKSGELSLVDINASGIITATQLDVSTGGLDVDGETQLDELVVAGVSTFSNDVTFTGASYNAVWDKSDNALEFAENAAAKFGEDADLEIYHATHSYIKNKTGSTAEIRIGS